MKVRRPLRSLDFVCPFRGRVSRAALSPGELYVRRGTADSVWAPSNWSNPFRVSEVGSAARAVKLYGEWLVTQKDLLRQLPRLDGKRLLCHCNKSSPCHLGLSHQVAINVASVHLTTLMCSRCVTGQTCRNSSTLDTTRALLSHESGMNASWYHVLPARKLCERCTRKP